jgi:hypothetical protein
VLADRFWWSGTIDVEAVCVSPAPRVTAKTFSVEDLLRRRHHFVDRVPAGVRGIGVAARLDSLHFR